MGSRGDVQPYAAIARGLMDAGHEVTLATHNRFQWLAEELSVPFRGLEQEPLLGFSRLVSAPSSLLSPAAWRTMKQSFFAALEEWDDAVAGADFVLAHPKIFVAPELARRHGAAVAFADTLPVSCPTSEYPCCYLAARPRGRVANRLSYRVLSLAVAPLRRWAVDWFAGKGVTDLRRGRWDLFHRDGTPVPHLHGHSPAVLPAPLDWPSPWRVTGYWKVGHPAEWTPNCELGAFLDSGDAPIYVGFGSMVYQGDRRRLTREIVRPLLDRGERVLLVRGWALDESDVVGEEGVYFMDAYEGPWHSWLFDRVKVVVHHGGPGTFGAALHAGRPQILCPFAIDQPFWARRAAELRVAPAPLPMGSWSAREWGHRIDAVLGGNVHVERARGMATQLSAEDGVDTAVEAIQEIARGRLPGSGRSG
jgi:sterol 3beta-glucosyltransferase